MAYENNVTNVTFISSINLNAAAHKHMFVDLSGTNAFKITLAAANGGIGVLRNAPLAGEHATVSIRGQVKANAGATISVGDEISAATSGYAAVHIGSFQVASGSVLIQKVVLGTALTAAASGSVFTMELNPRFTQVLSA
jgi:hypothetical protein